MSLIYVLKDSYDITFVSSKIPSDIIEKIRKLCTFLSISIEKDFFDILLPNDYVILDGYNFDSAYQCKIKQIDCKLIAIDDIPKIHHYADLIINHSEGLVDNDYCTESYTKLCKGMNYALLRNEFLVAASIPRMISKINTIFVCFGGSDSEDNTLLTLKEVIKSSVTRIIVVVGAAYSNYQSLASYCNKITNIDVSLYCNLDAKQMVSVLQESDLAVVPCSSIVYEVISVKMPIISGYTVDNQINIYNSLNKKRAIIGIAEFSVVNINTIIESIENSDVNRMIKVQSSLIDGQSLMRVKKAIQEL